MSVAPPAPGGVATLYETDRQGRAYRVKTLWAVRPGAPRGMVVRAAAHPSRRRVWFLIDGERRSRLTLPRSLDAWAYGASITLVPGPGCYAFRVSGAGVEDRLVFEAARA